MEQYSILNNLKDVQLSDWQMYYPDVILAFLAHYFPASKWIIIFQKIQF